MKGAADGLGLRHACFDDKRAGDVFGACVFWAGSARRPARPRPLPSATCQETAGNLAEKLASYLRDAGPKVGADGCPAPAPAADDVVVAARTVARRWLEANDGTSAELEALGARVDAAWTDASCGVIRYDNSRGTVAELR